MKILTLEKQLYKGVSWLAFYRGISQISSWVVTILVARILVPDDYALMEMATIITGYAAIFNQLGLGRAIIQRPEIKDSELTSVFWFSFTFSGIMGLSSFAVAYPTAAIFNQPRVIPITEVVSVLFLLTGLQIVPLNILKKDFNFKKVGSIQMTGILISSFSMLIIAKLGGGVWTLIGGHIIREFVKLVLTYRAIDWRPTWHFNYQEVKPFLKFGLAVSGSSSLRYVNEKADRFFAGRAWQPTVLGYYSFALQLAKIPNDKIVSLITQVSYSAFSKVHKELDKLQKLYLNTVKVSAIVVFPIFVGGFLVGKDLVEIILNEKWYPIIPVFRYLSLVQIFISLNAFNGTVHQSLGKPARTMYFNLISAILMPFSFYFAVKSGLNGILIPWFSTFLILFIGWIFYTLKKLDIRPAEYLNNLRSPIIATLVMTVFIKSIELFLHFGVDEIWYKYFSLSVKIVAGAGAYLGVLWFTERSFLLSLRNLRSSET